MVQVRIEIVHGELDMMIVPGPTISRNGMERNGTNRNTISRNGTEQMELEF